MIRSASASGDVNAYSRSLGARLTLSDIGKEYGEVTALQSVNLEVNAGEFLTFLGPSGSGKTTLLNLIAGFDTPSRGEIFVDGTPMTSVPTHRRGIGMVFQDYSLFPHLTVAENVAFALVERHVPKRERIERVAAALAMVGLAGFQDRRPSQLSGGQQQRTAIARALIYQPRLMLFDEPLGALDKQLREELQAELRRIHRELGITMLFVTHDQEEALALSDRIAVFRDGRIVQHGTAAELYRHPASIFVASFVGDSNLLTGATTGTAAAPFLDTAVGRLPLPVEAAGTVGVSAAPRLGAQLSVLLRPEHIVLRADQTVHPEESGRIDPFDSAQLQHHADSWVRVRARVIDQAFLGAFVQLTCQAAGGQLMKVRGTASERQPLRPGDQCELRWRVNDMLILNPDPVGSEATAAPASARSPERNLR